MCFHHNLRFIWFPVMLSLMWDSSFFLELSIWPSYPLGLMNWASSWDLSSLQSWDGAVVSCTLCCPDLGFLPSVVTVSGSVWEVALLSSCIRKKFSHFLNYLFPLSSVVLRIFLFMLLGFLTCLMIFGCPFIFKTEALGNDYFR